MLTTKQQPHSSLVRAKAEVAHAAVSLITPNKPKYVLTSTKILQLLTLSPQKKLWSYTGLGKENITK